MRRGYASEYRARNELYGMYSRFNVTKVAISQQGCDFLVICKGQLIKMIEVKEVHNQNYYPRKKEKEQIKRIREFAIMHDAIAEIWIYKYYKTKRVKKEIRIIYEPTI